MTAAASPIRIDGLDALTRTLMTAFPQATRRAARLAVSDAARSAKTEGVRIGRSEYTARRMGRVLHADVRRAQDHAVVSFSGAVGEPVRHFLVRPRGVTKRRPREGVMAKVRRVGAYRPVRGPKGQKTFWLAGKNGNLIIGYRAGAGRTVSTQGLFGASPVQAVAKRENAERIARLAEVKARERLWHQLGRVCKGDLR